MHVMEGEEMGVHVMEDGCACDGGGRDGCACDGGWVCM